MQRPLPLPAFPHFLHRGTVLIQKARQIITVHPDLVVSLFLRLVKDQLQPEMQMNRIYVVDIFLRAVPGMPHIADHIPCRHDIALLQLFPVRIVLAQVRIIIVALPVKAADADAPSAVLVPTDRLYVAGFYGDDWGSDRNIK